MPGPTYIEFANVEVAYNRHVTALRDVNLKVQRGELVFLLGRSGSGKSTFLKLLDREVKATGGSVTIGGIDLGSMPDRDVPMYRRRLGIIPQDFGLLPRKRAWENIGYAMRAVGMTRKQVRQEIGHIFDSVQIAHRADAFPNELSGGEQQRLAIARALINNPELILADEPTGNLDPQHSLEIMMLLQRLNQDGATVIVATHDMALLEQCGGRIVTLEAGRILSDEVRSV